ncbi:MAG: hypothetical protein JWO90_791, partial [Solirubrobacterales bacterium]|nr:hypothetical protein [Solirubrobacterales bacterium]
MHSLLHTDYTRALAADPRRGPAGSGAPRPPRPDAPPGRLRPLLAHALG